MRHRLSSKKGRQVQLCNRYSSFVFFVLLILERFSCGGEVRFLFPDRNRVRLQFNKEATHGGRAEEDGRKLEAIWEVEGEGIAIFREEEFHLGEIGKPGRVHMDDVLQLQQ